MNTTAPQSLFAPAPMAPRSWRSLLTSGLIHVVAVTLLLLVTFPTVREMTLPQEHVTLIAPVVPAYKPKVIPRPVVKAPVLPRELVKPVAKTVPPPVVKPPEPKPQVLAKAPEIKELAPVARNVPEAKLDAPPPPKPEIKTGVFANEQASAKGPVQPHDLKVGGFGDPNGAKTAQTQTPQLLAKVGGFDMPNGANNAGGGGRAQNGAVHSAGFGDGTGPVGRPGAHGTVSTGAFGSNGTGNGVPGGTGNHGNVKTGGFGDGASAGPVQTAQARPVAPTSTPVEILFKPKPAYTEEAKSMRLEGQVALEVVFLSNGSIKVVRVVHGLGHGLDEAAQQAAAQVRFKPATRGGSPVDTNATIYITFQLT